MNLYESFKTSAPAETSGVTLDYGDFRVVVARAGGANKAFLKACERFYRKHRRQIQTETLDDSVARRVLQEIYADTVLLGWEGVKGPDGADLPFTRENVLRVFEDLPAFWADVQEQAQNLALFREVVVEADSKN